LWTGNEGQEHAKACCGVDSVEDARRIAHKLGIPHFVLNMTDFFAQTVVTDFINEYTQGRTPNPCVRCNEFVKFRLFLHRAEALDADFIATGHHARIVKGEDERFHLLKGVDAQLFVAIALALLVGLAGLTQRYRPCLWAFLLSAVAAYGLPMLLVAHGLIVPPFPLLLSVLTAFIAVMVVLLETHWAALQRLQAFVAPSVTGEAMSTPGRFRVGERREVTVLFSDIRNFTPIAASLPPYEVVALLSSYFNRMTELVQLYGGIVDKFLGDGMMVLFGVLPHQDDHAQRAVLCAWQMLEELGTVNWEWERVTGTPLRIGIGINTGTAVIGEIGSEQRKELTALGASVNLAQRLEQLTKDVGASLLISESTYERVAHLVTAEPLEPLTVRGFDQPICVYRVTGLTEEGKRTRRLYWTAVV